MTRTCGTILLILMASSPCPASGGPSQPQVATVTGEIRNPISRELVFTYQLPSALEDFDEDVVLDSLDRFAFELPAVRGLVDSRGLIVERLSGVQDTDGIVAAIEKSL